ncbi:hypothetical protein [Corynebacterium matruchotii]|uniref:hypothetical protein n=1 Tax=Corynebacterium matruchotii TaxID=43768 RepID=UPI0028804C8A|nr:hypothetical protein [Corynebacterium matruchotii]
MHTFLGYGGSESRRGDGAAMVRRGGSNAAVRQDMRLAGWGWAPPALTTSSADTRRPRPRPPRRKAT